jgi:3-dehydroquinate synthase
MKKLSNRIITINRTPIFLGNDSLAYIDRLVTSLSPTGLFILVDPNTREHCLPILLNKAATPVHAQVVEIKEGEFGKSLGNAEKLWNELLSAGAGRSSLLFNLGGGVISDLGGFVAAGYKRGINYFNIPTSLVGQVDAAIGGKTAVNLGHIKNQIGFFHAPQAVFVSSGFLKTLPEEHLRSGMAEMIKSTLISNPALWRRLQKNPVSRMLVQPIEGALWQDFIHAAITFKNKVVTRDFRESNLRKILNFGHTIGHALEGYSQSRHGKPLLHGEAVAAGMICAAYLSHLKASLPLADLNTIASYLVEGFGHFEIDPDSKIHLMELMMHDKKVKNGQLCFVLISKPGFPVIKVACDQTEISEAIDFYNSLSR